MNAHEAMPVLEIALASSASADEKPTPPEWLKLVPYGVWFGRDGRGPYRNDRSNAELVVAATMADKQPKPIDYDHASDLALGAKAGQPSPAAAWFSQVEARDDGIWARVEWTPKGGTAVADREYRFISPTFHHKPDGTVTTILRAGLTNIPNFTSLPALASLTEEGTANMDDLLKTLAALLGLAVGASADQIVAAVKALKEQTDATTEEVTAAIKSLGLTDGSPLKAVLAAAISRAGGDKSIAELNATVASQGQTIADLNKDLAGLKAANAESAAEAAVTAAMQAGKVAPAAKAWALNYAKGDAAGFKAYVDAMPAVLKPGTDLPAVASAGEGAGGLSKDELAIASQLGLTPEQFAETKKKEAAA